MKGELSYVFKMSDYKDRIPEVINYIQNNLELELKVKDLADLIFMSESHFKKLFKEVTGENVSDYTRRIRLEQAQYMLLQNQHRSITDIALCCGFSSSASFARAFRQYFQISASDFRSNNINTNIISFGTPFLKNIHPEDYDGFETIYSVCDDGTGKQFFSSQWGEVYEYYDETWQKHYFPELHDVLSLAIDRNRTLWVGGRGQLGYIIAENNKYIFISLLDHIPPKERSFNHVWKTLVTEEGIYFQTKTAIFRWHCSAMTLIKTENSFSSLSYINGKIYVMEYKKGLMEVEGDMLKKARGSQQIINEHLAIYNFLPYDKKRVFCLTRNKGCFLYDGSSFVPFETEVDHLFEKAGLVRSIYLPDIGYALGTRSMGLFIIDKAGKIITTINSKRGLINDYIRSLYYTENKILLIGMTYGAAMLNIDLPVMIYNRDAGITTMVNSIIRYKGILYCASDYGILRENHNYNKNILFERLPYIQTKVNDLLEVKGSLCIAYSFGLYIIKEDGTTQNFNLNIEIKSLCASSYNKNVLNATLADKIVSFYYSSGNWKQGRSIEGFSEPLYRIVEGYNNNLFCNGIQGTIFRVSFLENGSYDIATYRLPAQKQHASSELYQINGLIMVTSNNGIYQYDKEEDAFITDTYLGPFFNNKIIHYLAESKNGIWIIEGRSRNIYYIKNDDKNDRKRYPFLRSPGLMPVTIYSEENGISWIGGNSSLIRCNMKEKET